jgi:hypothetical protein
MQMAIEMRVTIGERSSTGSSEAMTTNDRRRQVFRRMLTREAGVDVDAAGVAAIYTRSLHLVQRQFPGLASGRESDQSDGPFVRVQQSLALQQSAVASEAAVALFTTVGELLASFIGEPLTMRLLREAWPADFASDVTEETIT